MSYVVAAVDTAAPFIGETPAERFYIAGNPLVDLTPEDRYFLAVSVFTLQDILVALVEDDPDITHNALVEHPNLPDADKEKILLSELERDRSTVNERLLESAKRNPFLQSKYANEIAERLTVSSDS